MIEIENEAWDILVGFVNEAWAAGGGPKSAQAIKRARRFMEMIDDRERAKTKTDRVPLVRPETNPIQDGDG